MNVATHNTLDFQKMNTRKEKWMAILSLAWPLIIANSFWNLQLTIDRVYLSNYSTEALGAAMAVMGIFWTPMALLQQTAAYLMTFVAQYFGAKEHRMIGPAIWQAIYVSVIGGLLFLMFIPFSKSIFSFIGHTDKMTALEIEYFNALCYSALPTALVAVASSFFTGLGNTRVVMGINAVGLVVNVIFDYLFIFGKMGIPAMGVAGAGYATALANWAGAFYGFYLVFQRKYEKDFAVFSGWRYHADLMKRYIRYGIPSGLQWALEGLAFSVFLIFVGRMANGDAALSGSSIVVTIMMLGILPTFGLAQAASVLVGQYLGDKKPEQAEVAVWSAFQVGYMYIIFLACTYLLIPQFYLSWFHNPENPVLWEQVSNMVPYLLMFVALFSTFDTMNLIFSFSLKGAGDTKFVTLIALVLPWPLMVLPTIFMRDWPGAVYWAWGAASVFGITQAIIFLLRFKGGKWKLMSVIH